MAKPIRLDPPPLRRGPLTVEELEVGLLELGSQGQDGFWEDHVEVFRDTILAAIRETSDVLRAEGVPPKWRSELNRQLRAMHDYVEVADLYLARRSGQTVHLAARRLH